MKHRSKFMPALLSIAMMMVFSATALAETQNIVIEPSVNSISTAAQLPIIKAKSAIPPFEHLTAIFGLDGGERTDYDSSTRISIGNSSLNYFSDPQYSASYEREEASTMLNLVTYDKASIYEFDGAWLSDGSREASFMSRDDAQKIIVDILEQFGVSSWDTDIRLYYIDRDDWRNQIEINKESIIKSADIGNCKDIYFAFASLSNGGVIMDTGYYDLLNQRTITMPEISFIIDEEGLLYASISSCYGINEITEPKPVLGYDEAVSILDEYYGDLYMSHQINVAKAEFVYCPYPTSQTEYDILPTLKFGIRGFAEGADYIREYVRIDATSGRILE